MEGGCKKLESDIIIALKLNLLLVMQFGERRCCAFLVSILRRLYLEIVNSLIQYLTDISRIRFARYLVNKSMRAKVDERRGTFVSQFCKSKNDLRNINNANFDLPEGTKLYINETLCLCYKSFGMKA